MKIISILIIIVNFFILLFDLRNKSYLDYPKFTNDIYKKIFDLLNKKNNFDIFNKCNKIDNIFILITIFPFLKKKIILTEKNPIYELYKNIFHIKKKRIEIKREYFVDFSHKFSQFLKYKWETLPNKNKTNYLRHIIYHYYSKENLNIYDESLNLNIYLYINNNIKKISIKFINELMSKILYNLF